MNLDSYLARSHEEVNQAIVQFAARRSYRLRQPWYLDGMRIEAPPNNHSTASDLSHGESTMNKRAAAGGVFSIFGDDVPRIDVNLRRKRGRTRLRITVGHSPAGTQLAYELQNYLQDDRAYDGQCPARCPKCGSPVRNMTANYCGRCGQKLVASERDNQPRLAVPVDTPRRASPRHEVAPPPVPISAESRKEIKTPATLEVSPAEPEVPPAELPRVEEKEEESATIHDGDKPSDNEREALPSAPMSPSVASKVESIEGPEKESAEEEPPDSTDVCPPVEEQPQRRAIAED